MKKKAIKKTSRLTSEILETARDMRKSGVIGVKAAEKITLRHLASKPLRAKRITAAEIRALRTKAHISQAVLAKYLKVTPGYVSQLERGEKEPKGPALVLLDVVKRKGLEAIQ